MDSGFASSMRPGMTNWWCSEAGNKAGTAPDLAPDGQISGHAVQPCCEKYSASLSGRSIFRTPAIPSHTEGRFAIVTNVGHGMRWTRQRRRAIVVAGRGPTRERLQARRRTMLLRTAKSCGPDASTPASSFAEAKSARPGADQPYSQDDGDKKARSPGRSRRKPLKPLRGECRVAPVNLWWLPRVLFTFCTRDCGCSAHPAFPAPSIFSRVVVGKARAFFTRRDREGVCV